LPRGYVRVRLCFPFEGDKATKDKALRRLSDAYEVAPTQWPFLAGVVMPTNLKEQDVLEVQYMLQPKQEVISRWFGESDPGEKM
jgi:hypothetical protein